MSIQTDVLAKEIVAASKSGEKYDAFITRITGKYGVKSGSLRASMSKLKTDLFVASSDFKVSKDIVDDAGNVIVKKGTHKGQALHAALNPKSFPALRDDSRLAIVEGTGFELPTLDGAGTGKGGASLDRLALVNELMK